MWRLFGTVVLAGLGLGLGPGMVQALEFADGRLQIHGFASQAAVNTSTNRYFGDSPDTSYEFTELGLNGSFLMNTHLLVAGQLLVRKAGDMYDGSPTVDYALFDYTPLADAQHRLGARLGRLKNPLGLYNETRDVPFTRPGIFLPQIYYDKVRNLQHSSDGLMFYGDLYREFGDLSLTLGGGQAVIDQNVEWAFLGNDFDGDLKPDGISGVGSLWYMTPAERFKLGLSGVRTQMKFDAGLASPLASGTIELFQWIASLQYNAEDWTLSAEYSRTPMRWNDFGPYFPFKDQVMEGYYIQGAYRVRPNIELMLRYDEGFANRTDRDGSGSSALTGGLTPEYDFYSKIWTLGLRWDINPNIMLRLEYQRQDGTWILSLRENPDPTQRQPDWDVLAASISVRF